jgi:hypothetical protein
MLCERLVGDSICRSEKKKVIAAVAAHDRAADVGLLVPDGDRRAGENGAAGIVNRADDRSCIRLPALNAAI